MENLAKTNKEVQQDLLLHAITSCMPFKLEDITLVEESCGSIYITANDKTTKTGKQIYYLTFNKCEEDED